jgi:hypothetical protein
MPDWFDIFPRMNILPDHALQPKWQSADDVPFLTSPADIFTTGFFFDTVLGKPPARPWFVVPAAGDPLRSSRRLVPRHGALLDRGHQDLASPLTRLMTVSAWPGGVDHPSPPAAGQDRPADGVKRICACRFLRIICACIIRRNRGSLSTAAVCQQRDQVRKEIDTTARPVTWPMPPLIAFTCTTLARR